MKVAMDAGYRYYSRAAAEYELSNDDTYYDMLAPTWMAINHEVTFRP